MRIYGIRTESYIKFYNNYDDAFIEFLDMQKKYYAKHSQLSELYQILYVDNGKCVELETIVKIKSAYENKKIS